MNARNTLLSAAGGFALGYAAYRALEAAAALAAPRSARKADASAYGALRRALATAGIARSIASSAATAYGPLAARFERNAQAFPQWLAPAVFAAQIALVDAVAELPVEFAEGHEVERRFGLTEQTPESWLGDYVKGQALTGGVAAVLALLLGAALRKWPQTWAYYATAGTLPLLVAANVAVPVYVLPLFNTYVPLEGPLEQRLRALAARFGVGDAQILRMDMSKQTKKANAFVIGIGRTHRIVVADTLIDHFTPEEIEFVVAHELGHYVSKDTWRFIAVGQLAAGAAIFAARAALGNAPPEQIARPGTLAKIQFIAGALAQVLRPAIAAFSRSREWSADRFAVSATNDPLTGASAFRRLRDQNLAEDEQPAWFEFLFSTHPSLKARIAALEGAAKG